MIRHSIVAPLGAILYILSISEVAAFSLPRVTFRGRNHLSPTPLNAAVSPSLGTSIPETSAAVREASDNVLQVAKECYENSASGLFLSKAKDKDRLKRAVAQLEALSSGSTIMPSTIVGDWKLICTTNYKTPVNSKLPFQKESSSGRFRESLKVVQRIRKTSGDAAFDSVDNIIVTSPPPVVDTIVDEVSSLFKSSPFPLRSFIPVALNPLNVTKSKVTLKHKATIESTKPLLRTKISLKSIVLTVAGKSQLLNPAGADVLGLNVPLGDFLNAGSFDTTYADESIRISRGTIGFLDELRVFVREDGAADMAAGSVENVEKELNTTTVSETFQTLQKDLQSASDTAQEETEELISEAANFTKQVLQQNVTIDISNNGTTIASISGETNIAEDKKNSTQIAGASVNVEEDRDPASSDTDDVERDASLEVSIPGTDDVLQVGGSVETTESKANATEPTTASVSLDEDRESATSDLDAVERNATMEVSAPGIDDVSAKRSVETTEEKESEGKDE